MDINFHWQPANASIIAVATEFPDEACFIGIYGASGAGKSSFLRCLAGLESNLHAYQRDVAKTLREYGKRVGVVFQSMQLFPHLNVAENLCFAQQYAAPAGTNAVKEPLNYAELLDWFEIRHLLKQSVASLSGGETQRVAIVRALLNQPDVLLLDEALTGLDKRLRRQVLQVLAQLPEFGISVVMVSHDIRELTLVSDHVWQVDAGRIRLQVPVWELSHALAAQIAPALLLQHPDLLFCTVHVPATKVSNDSVKLHPFSRDEIRLGSAEHLTSRGLTRIIIAAEKLVLTREQLPAVSLLNCIKVTISAMESITSDDYLVLLALNFSGQRYVLPCIQSNTAVHTLALQVGDSVQAYF